MAIVYTNKCFENEMEKVVKFTVGALMENDLGSHAHCMGSSTPVSTLWESYPFAP